MYMQHQTTVATPVAQETNSTAPQPQRTRCEVWTRVMGYHRPVSHFKKAEHYSRKHFQECKAANQTFVEKYLAAKA